MNNNKSWARQVYEQCYRLNRRSGYQEGFDWTPGFPQEIGRAADYSYQAYDYEASGWISSAREKRFYAIKYRIEAARDWLTC